MARCKHWIGDDSHNNMLAAEAVGEKSRKESSVWITDISPHLVRISQHFRDTQFEFRDQFGMASKNVRLALVGQLHFGLQVWTRISAHRLIIESQSALLKPLQRQEPDRMPRLRFGRQIGQDFADHRGELEAVAAEAARDEYVLVRRMPIDDEV